MRPEHIAPENSALMAKLTAAQRASMRPEHIAPENSTKKTDENTGKPLQ